MSSNYFMIGEIIKNGIPCWSEQVLLKNGLLHGFIGKFNSESPIDELGRILGRENILELKQIHSDTIIDVDEFGIDKIIEARNANTFIEGDAFIFNNEQETPFMAVIKTADCLPVIIKGSRRTAIVHAGWRGLASGILEKAARQVIYKCANRSLKVIIGPAICGKCYEVGDEVAKRFDAQCISHTLENNKYLLNLIVGATLSISKVRQGAEILNCGICTKENQNYFSYRRNVNSLGRNITFVAL